MHHLIIFSKKISPILMPLLDGALQVKTVTILVPVSLNLAYNDFERVIKSYQKSVNPIKINDHATADEIREILNQVDHRFDGINVTSDMDFWTAVVSMHYALQNIPIYTVDSYDRLNWINQPTQHQQILDAINLEDFSSAHGLAFSREHRLLTPNVRNEFYEFFFHRSKESRRNLLQAIAKTKYPKSKTEYFANGMHPQIIELFNFFASNTNYISRTEHYYIFHNSMLWRFFKGAWLEHYVYDQVISLKKSCPDLCIQDVAMSGTFNISHDSSVKNEMDVVVLANNKITLIECKTNVKDGPTGNSILYKLSAIKSRIGDPRTNAMLVSSNKLSNGALDRARDADIVVASDGGIGITELPNALKQAIYSGMAG